MGTIQGMKRAWGAVLLLVWAIGAWAQAPQTNVSLVTEQSAVKPGSTVWVGLHFQLEPGWHMYWLNPGDAGEPAKVQWTLPIGWTASEIQWPAPTRLQNAAGVDFGYNEQATLLTKVKVPATAKSGPNDLKADLRWLACKDVCVPQKGTAAATVRVAPTAMSDANGKAVIAAAKAQLPKALPEEWKANVITSPGQMLLNFMPGVKVDAAAFFPLEKQVIENAAPQKLSATSSRAQLSLKKDASAPKPKMLKGVLVLNGTDAYTVNLPVK
jgi:DsbC/DsbD-like thiol-disulfide interchange protein